MLEPKRIARFALLVVIAYAVLMGVRTWVEPVYASVFRGIGNVAFQRFWLWGDGCVTFHDLKDSDLRAEMEAEFYDQVHRSVSHSISQGRDPNIDMKQVKLPANLATPGPEDVKDTLMIMWNRKTPGSFGQLKTSSRLIGYAPTVFVLALFLATPTTWRRRLLTAVCGLLVVQGFVLFRLTLTLAADGFAWRGPAGTFKSYTLMRPSEFWYDVLDRSRTIIVNNPTCYLFVVVVIWLSVCFLTGSISAFRSDEPSEPGASGE